MRRRPRPAAKRGWPAARHRRALGPSHSRGCRGLVLAAGIAALVLTARAEPVDFRLPELGGRTVELSHYRGRWVLVNFWATWCLACREEMPELLDFRRAHPEVAVLGVNLDPPGFGQVQGFVDELGVDFPILRVSGREPPAGFVLYGLPTTFFVSPDGEIRKAHQGALDMAQAERMLREIGYQGRR